jgi:hypothetical protein
MQALPDHVLMMQIDCEVINTGLVHIKEDAIPIHLSSRMRSEPDPATASTSAASNSSLQVSISETSLRLKTFGANFYPKVLGSTFSF